MNKLIAGSVLAVVAALGLTACGDSESDIVKQGPYEGQTFIEAVRDNGVAGVPEDYYLRVCDYLKQPVSDETLTDQEIFEVGDRVGKDMGIDIYDFNSLEAGDIGTVIGLGVATGCPEYIPLFEDLFAI